MGIGNVWRFPYLAYKNGGAAFLFPYFILLIFVGKPMYYLETAIGQFSRLSPLHVWRCAPIAKGVGFGMIILSLVVSIYYNVIMSYSLIYVGASIVGITDELPWTTCGNWILFSHLNFSVLSLMFLWQRVARQKSWMKHFSSTQLKIILAEQPQLNISL